MSGNTRARRLALRYPDLAAAPEEERAAIVRRALMHPVVIGLLLACAVFVLPPYLSFAFDILHVEGDTVLLSQLGKLALAALVPAMLLTWAMSRWLIPVFIRGIMKKRGYLAR